MSDQDRDGLRGSFRDNPTGATLIVVTTWTIVATGFIAFMILAASLFPWDADIQWYPHILAVALAYFGWVCWRIRLWLVEGREKPKWWGADD